MHILPGYQKMGGLKMNMLSKRRQTQLYLFLIILSVLASFKMIFFAVGLDEEYQLVMAYRNVGIGNK